MEKKLNIGDVLDGKIIKIVNFGAIVLLSNNQKGLIHISQISHKFVKNINNHLAIGDIVKVVVSNISEKGKIDLSVKQLKQKKKPEEIKPTKLTFSPFQTLDTLDTLVQDN